MQNFILKGQKRGPTMWRPGMAGRGSCRVDRIVEDAPSWSHNPPNVVKAQKGKSDCRSGVSPYWSVQFTNSCGHLQHGWQLQERPK